MGKPFNAEILAIPDTLSWALRQDVTLLKRTVSGASDKNLLVIGSGGSFSAAAYLAQLHEQAFGRVSRASTPLEYVMHRKALPSGATVLVSAEGKNKDILAAAEAMLLSQSTGFALTLTPSNALVEFCHETGVATSIYFEMPWIKDGYLATNSLLATMTLAARAYSNGVADEALGLVDAAWLQSRRQKILTTSVLTMIPPDRPVIVLFGGVGRIAAIDMESKFAEGAIGTCQPVDYRQFAHGRHLQLMQQPQPFVIAFDSNEDRKLADCTLAQLPCDVPVLRLDLPSDPISAEIFGVIDVLLIIDEICRLRGVDVGQPIVPLFGREIYSLDVRKMRLEHDDELPLALIRKFPPYGPAQSEWSQWEQAACRFCDRLENARFKGLVCDFDGTCCDTDRRFEGLDVRLKDELERLILGGAIIAFATGRGDSLYDDLRTKLNPTCWPKVIVGYYSGSVILGLDTPVPNLAVDKRLEALERWLGKHGLLNQLGSAPKLSGGQLSLRVQNHAAKSRAIAAVNYWIGDKKEVGWRVYCSGHSIDVLTDQVGKRSVVDEVVRVTQANPDNEILRIGDSGDMEGNDFELLSAGLGLSVAAVSPIADSCWNLLPKHRRGSVGMQYYLSALVVENGTMRFAAEFIEHARQICTIKGTKA